VNFALGWHLQLPAEGSRDITIIVAIDESRELRWQGSSDAPAGGQGTHRLAHEDDNAWLKRAKPVKAGATIGSGVQAVAAEPAAAGGSSTRASSRRRSSTRAMRCAAGMATAGRAMRPRAVVALEDAGYDEYTRGWRNGWWTRNCRRACGDRGTGCTARWRRRGRCAMTFCNSMRRERDDLALRGARRTPDHVGRDVPWGLRPAIRMGALALLGKLDANVAITSRVNLWETYAGVFVVHASGPSSRPCGTRRGGGRSVGTVGSRDASRRGRPVRAKMLMTFYQHG